MSLPRGFRSVKRSPEYGNSLYLLLECDHRLYPVICRSDGSLILDAESRDDVMAVIASEVDEEPPMIMENIDVDGWIVRAVEQYSLSRRLPLERISVVCTSVLVF
jgi:hypothetical protein